VAAEFLARVVRQLVDGIAIDPLADARILERADLQECIYNSSSEFFAEIGERVFVLGKEVIPSQTVPDRIDLLGIDVEGTTVIVELKRGSTKLQMLQAVSYAGMLSRWGQGPHQGPSHDHAGGQAIIS